MALKSDVQIKEKKEFPKLIVGSIYNGTPQIILATGRKDNGSYIGTNISGAGYDFGYYSENWDGSMKDFTGIVSISSL